MEVRRANTGDMAQLMDFLEKYHYDSNLADVPLDRTSLVKVLEYYIGSKDSIALVSVQDDELKGVLLGSLEPFFFNRKKSYATDLLFISDGGGPALWRKFVEWAKFRGAVRVMMGISSGNNRAGALLEHLGMKHTGGMYVLRCESS